MRFLKKCPKCGSPYYREYDLIGAIGRKCRICDFWWDNTEKLDEEQNHMCQETKSLEDSNSVHEVAVKDRSLKRRPENKTDSSPIHLLIASSLM